MICEVVFITQVLCYLQCTQDTVTITKPLTTKECQTEKQAKKQENTND